MSLRDAGLVDEHPRRPRRLRADPAPADEIRMSDVLRALEGPIAPMICATDDPEHGLDLRPDLVVHRQLPVGPRPRRDRRRARRR